MSGAADHPDWLEKLAAAMAELPEASLAIGFSGGLDSTVLLHALSQLPAARKRGLLALHVDHGNGAYSVQWAEHCRVFASRLGVEFQVVQANVQGIAEHGLEGAWRRARLEAFEANLPAPCVLGLAHHREDQAETLLLRLLHAAGSEGLAGMRRLRPLRGNETARWLWRPLLDVPRAPLREYAQRHGLEFIDDPANSDSRHARTRLRTHALPALREAFPDADARIAAAALRLREEADALRWVASNFIENHRHAHDSSLPAAELSLLPNALRREVVSRWLDALKLPRPPAGIWPRIVAELIGAAPDAKPKLHWNGAQLRRYRNRLFAFAPFDESPSFALEWNGTEPLPLPQGLGTLCIEPALPSPQRWLVRNRGGGERLRLQGVHRSLKHLLQESAIAPWQRGRLPLVFDADGQLLAAGEMTGDALKAQLAAHAAQLMLRR